MRHESRLKFLFFACLIVIFYLAQHNVFISLHLAEGKSTYAVAEAVKEGTPSRQIAYLFLALISILSLTTKGQTYIRINGILGWLILFFLFWASLSIFWASDMFLTSKRVMIFLILWLGALAFARRYSVADIVLFSLIASGCFLVLGLGTEIILGTFRPNVAGYRFGGTLHPNPQGANCAVLFLAAIVMRRIDGHHRRFLFGVAVIAFVCLVLTRSRGALIAGLLGFLAYEVLTASRTKQLSWVLLITWITALLFLISYDNVISTLQRAILMGREGNVSELSGRTPLWEECLTYVAMRPLHGYGFNAFWTTKTVYEIAGSAGWAMAEAHSAYIDIVLGVGLIGLGVFILLFLFGIKRCFVFYRSNLDMGYAFFCAMLVFGIVNGLIESATFTAEWPSFLYLFILAHAGLLRLPAHRKTILVANK